MTIFDVAIIAGERLARRSTLKSLFNAANVRFASSRLSPTISAEYTTYHCGPHRPGAREPSLPPRPTPTTPAHSCRPRSVPPAPYRSTQRSRRTLIGQIGRIQAPLPVVLGERDDIVPPAMGRAVLAAAPEPKKLWTAPDGGHETLAQFGLIEAVTRSLARVMGK